MSVNKVILVGHVGADPKIHAFDNGDKVASFSLATTERWKNKDGEKMESTEWHNIVANRKLAEVVETYIKKGSQLYIEGSIKTREYTDKSDSKRYITEVFCRNIQMLGSKKEAEVKSEAKPVVNQGLPGDDTDNLPF